ncbi:protein DinB [Heyndrickxia sporothermodurans]|nr:protein DinB [Heyndrickxia sporothermodurans]
MTNPVLEMYKYHVWANEVIMNRLKELPEEVYHKDIQSGFSSISKVLSHVYFVDHSWYEIIKGKSMRDAFSKVEQIKEQIEAKPVDEMRELFSILSKKYMIVLNKEEDFDKTIVVDNPYAGLLETSTSETIMHVVTHGAYHRGNIATMLRQLGQISVMQDYGLYLYDKQKR